jgi:polyisoprenoid-binding protein YceI
MSGVNVWLKRAVIAIPLLVAGFFGALLLYVNVIRDDPPAALGRDDLAAAVAGAPSTVPTTVPAAVGTETGAYDGVWTVTDESEFGYRVEEVLFGVNTTAAGRSNAIVGDLTVAGSTVPDASFTVDVASITSDDSRRDGQFRNEIMDTAQFPEATFRLTRPIELGSAPAPGQQVTASATGDLTLHGVTRAVTFDVTAEAGTDRIGVLGSIPIVFADYDIDNPSRSGITTEDHGVLEFVLVFVPA